MTNQERVIEARNMTLLVRDALREIDDYGEELDGDTNAQLRGELTRILDLLHPVAHPNPWSERRSA